MTLYGTSLAVHVITAILLVGGSFQVTGAHLRAMATDDVGGVRADARYMAATAAWLPRFAALTLVAALVLVTDLGLWGATWVHASLALFVLGGGLAGAVVDPALADLTATLDDAPDGPVPAAVTAALRDRRLLVGTALLTAVDVAIVVLMTNKPATTGAVLVAVVALAVGGVAGLARTSRPGAPSAA